MIGHIDHGKTTLTEALSGIWTDRHSEELKRGISIKLGYADTIFAKCEKCKTYTTKTKCPDCGSETIIIRRISFVDAPGHETLMATMLSGAAIMDGAVLVIAANEPCPQPQTKEHLMGLEIIGVENIVVAQNKIELASREQVLENYKQIRKFLDGTPAKDAPIIPVSAIHGIGVSKLIETILKTIPVVEHDVEKPPKIHVARSFDTNRPGVKPEKIIGGVLGGSLVQGKLKIGDEVEIQPGLPIEKGGKVTRTPITTKVVGLRINGESRDEATPGGLLGVSTTLDPSLTKADSLSGSVAGLPGSLPELRESLTLEINLLERVVGLDKELEVAPLTTGEPLMINVGTATTVGIVTSAREKTADMKLKLPVCADKGTRVAISRRVESRWRLIGYGIIS